MILANMTPLNAPHPCSSNRTSPFFKSLWGVILICAVLIPRSAGLFHGLESGSSFHPDTTKQVQAVQNFLNGTYVWTTGSLAYDGYAYGLNHLDEWIIRVVRPPLTGLRHALDPTFDVSSPTRAELFLWCRVLRLLYGGIAAGLLYSAAARLGFSLATRSLVLLLFAAAPLASTVTHFASGDIGIDLFVALALWFFTFLYRDKAPLAYWGMGFAVGSAFACKYNGFLANALPLACLLLISSPLRQRLKLLGLLLAGNVLGFLWLTPQFFQLPKRTLELIGLNFGYIATYGAPEGFYDLPLFTRVWSSLQQNIPLTAHALGWWLIALCLVALAFFTRRVLTGYRDLSVLDAGGFSLLAFAFAALLISLAGKPAVQPFHFSYLLLPLLLGFGSFLHQLPPGGPRRILTFFALIAVGIGLVQQQRESFFWMRQDMRDLALRAHQELLKPTRHDGPSEKTEIAFFKVEEANDAVFRNIPQRVKAPQAQAWDRNPAPSFPQIHWPLSQDWIFPETGMFPRESRSIWLRPETTVQYSLARNEQHAPEHLLFFQCGQRAATVHLRSSYKKYNPVHLRAFDHLLLPIGLHVPGIQTLTLTTEGGMVWCRLPSTPEQAKAMLVTMGQKEEEMNGTSEDLAQLYGRPKFLEGCLSSGRDKRNATLYEGPMSGGTFLMSVVTTDPQPPTLDLLPLQSNHPEMGRSYQGIQTKAGWEFQFTKPAHPLFVRLSLTHGTHACTWELKPVPHDGIIRFPENMATTAGLAEQESVVVSATNGSSLSFPRVPAVCRIGEPVWIYPTLSIGTLRSPLQESFLFLHLLDAGGQQVWAQDLALQDVSQSTEARLPFALQFDLPAGTYTLHGGFHHPRLFRRWPLDPDVKKDRAFLQPLSLEAK